MMRPSHTHARTPTREPQLVELPWREARGGRKTTHHIELGELNLLVSTTELYVDRHSHVAVTHDAAGRPCRWTMWPEVAVLHFSRTTPEIRLLRVERFLRAWGLL